MDLKARIGKKVGPFREEVTSERVHAFCKAVHAPVSETAPATYLTRFRAGEFALFQELEIPLSRLLHAEQEYFYESPLIVGDTIEYETTFANVLSKSGNTGTMFFATFESRFRVVRSGKETPIGASRTTIVVR